MSERISAYLLEVERSLGLRRRTTRRIVRELEAHLGEAVERGREAGLSRQEAEQAAIERIGPAALVAERFRDESSVQRRWRPIALAVVVSGALLAGVATALVYWVRLGGGTSPKRVVSSMGYGCIQEVVWHGTTYESMGNRYAPNQVAGRYALGRGTVPKCGTESGSPVSLFRVRGIPPRAAVATSLLAVYVAPGYFPEQPGTELHNLAYGRTLNLPDARRPHCDLPQARTITGPVRSAYFGTLTLRARAPDGRYKPTYVFTDVHTRFSGWSNSIPSVRLGDRVRAQVVVCRDRNERHYRKLVAIQLALLHPTL